MAPSTLPPPSPTPSAPDLPPPSIPTMPPPLSRSRVAPAASSPRREWSPVGVIAAVGVLFILIAALSVTVSRWDSIGAALRAGGLAVLAGLAVLCAERIRKMAATTALAVAVVGTGLAFPVGVATMSALGYTWPICLSVGALLATPLAEWQRRHWPPIKIAGHLVCWFDVLQLAALAVGSFGVAALVGVPAGLIAVILAAALVALGANWRGVGLATLAVTAPILGVLADGGIGAGTLTRAGVVGERLGWFGPLVGVVAAGVVFVAGRRVGSRALEMLSPLFALAGFVAGLTAIDAAPAAWASVPGLLLAVAAGMWHVGTPREDRQRLSTSNVPGPLNVTLALSGAAVIFGGIVAMIGLVVAPGLVPVGTSYAFSAAMSIIGLAMCWPIVRGRATDLVLVGMAAGTTIATSAVAANVALAAVPAQVLVAIVAGVAALVSTWLARTPVAASVTLATSLIALLGSATANWAVALVLLAAWLATTTLAITLRRPAATAGSVSAIGLLTACAATWIWRAGISTIDRSSDLEILGQTLVVFLVVLLVAAGTLAVVREARRFVGWPVIVGGGYAFVVACAERVAAFEVAAGFAAIAVAAVVWQRVILTRTSRVLVGGALGATAATTIAAIGGAVTTQQFGLLATIALAAIATWAAGRSVSLAVGAATVAFAAVTASAAPLVALPLTWVAATWFVLGVAGAMFAWRWGQPWVAAGSAAIAFVAAVAWAEAVGVWNRLAEWLSGVTAWLSKLLAAVDMTTDEAIAILLFVVAVAGASILLRKTRANSVLLFGPEFLFITMIAIPAQVDRQAAWTLPFAIIAGVVAIVIGAQRKVTGLLVGGIGLSSAVVITASRATLVLVPGWAWVGLGGVVLLGTALAVERVAGGWDGVRRQANYLARTWR